MNDGDSACRLILRCRLYKRALATEQALEFGVFEYLVELDGLWGSLELEVGSFAVFLETNDLSEPGSSPLQSETYRSQIFLTCIFLFFSSSFVLPELGSAAAASDDVSAATEVRARLAGLWSWSWADAASWSSSYALGSYGSIRRGI